MSFSNIEFYLHLIFITCISFSLNNNGVICKSLPDNNLVQPPLNEKPKNTPSLETVSLSPVANDYQQPQSQHNGEMNYPQYDDENVGSYDYRSSSEEVMPVKNSEFVPVESPEDYNNTNGFIPQRQESLQDFWQQYHNSMMQQQNQNNKEVTDEGNFEVAGVPNNNNYYAGDQPQPMQPELPPPIQHPQQEEQDHQYYQHNPYYQIPNQQYYEEVLPIAAPTPAVAVPPVSSTPKVSKVAKLTVIAGKNAEGNKIAIVKAKSRVDRQKRSMMTLSREDENDSEYDDVNSSEKKYNSTSTTARTVTKTVFIENGTEQLN